MADNEKMVLTKGSSDQAKAAVARNNSTMSATKLTAAQANLKKQFFLIIIQNKLSHMLRSTAERWIKFIQYRSYLS